MNDSHSDALLCFGATADPVIRVGDVRRMSEGTGISHSECNASQSKPVHILQIWIVPVRRVWRQAMNRRLSRSIRIVAGRPAKSAIWKSPVPGRVAARGINFDGDEQADRKAHGKMGRTFASECVSD